MKFLSTTTIYRGFILLLICSLVVQTHAQRNTDSPYSDYGVGLINPLQFNGNFGMAGTGIAWRPYHYKPQIYDSLTRRNVILNDRGSNFINPTNPASFSNVSLTTFEVGAISRNTEATSGEQSRNSSNTQLSHVAMAFPISERGGMAFGIRPFSFVGYDYSTNSVLNGETVTNNFEGSGGVNEVFVGTAFTISSELSVGFTGLYRFGTLVRNRRLIFDNTSNFFFNSLDQSETTVNAVAYQVGIQYFKDLNKEYRFLVGATASPIQELSARESRLIQNYTGEIDNENFRDTGLFVNDQRVKLPNSATFGLGFALEHKKKWSINLDLTRIDFGDVSVDENVNLTSSTNASLSFNRFVNSGAFGSYLKKIGYRAGIRYNSSLVEVNGNDISEFGIALGIIMPLRKSFSTLNIGVELGRRGMDRDDLIREDFFNLQLGITINDRWFIQRKYD